MTLAEDEPQVKQSTSYIIVKPASSLGIGA